MNWVASILFTVSGLSFMCSAGFAFFGAPEDMLRGYAAAQVGATMIVAGGIYALVARR